MFDLEGVHNLLLRSIVVFNVSKLHVSLLTSGSTLCEQTKSGASSMSYQDPCAKQELSLMQYFVLLVQMEKLIGYFNSGCGLGAFHNWGKKILDCGLINCFIIILARSSTGTSKTRYGAFSLQIFWHVMAGKAHVGMIRLMMAAFQLVPGCCACWLNDMA